MIAAFSGLRAGWVGAAASALKSFIGSFVLVREAQQSVGLGHDLGDRERLAADPVVALGVDQELGPDQQQELAEVDLRDQAPAVAPEDLLGVGREGVQVAE